MGIFVNALCEEAEFLDNTGFDTGAVADPDDKYAVELQDVAKAVEDINQNYADQSSEEELDGQDLEEDPVSECMIAIYESEHNWNQIMNALAAREVLEAARGREMVMESVDIKGFFTKVKEFFVKMWKKITAVVKQWLGNASAVLRTNKSFASKYKSTLKKGEDAYFANSGYKEFKGYDFGDFDKETIKFSVLKDSVDSTNMDSIMNAIRDGNLSSIEGSYNGNAKRRNPEIVRGSLIGSSERISADDYRNKLKEKFFGSTEKKTLKKGAKSTSSDYILKVLSDDMKIGDVKKAYGELKTSINKIIKQLNDAEKKIKALETQDEATSKAITLVSKWSTDMKECQSAAHLALTTMMKATHARAAQCRRIGNAYIFALNKKTRKGAWDAADGKKVAHEGGFLANVEMI